MKRYNSLLGVDLKRWGDQLQPTRVFQIMNQKIISKDITYCLKCLDNQLPPCLRKSKALNKVHCVQPCTFFRAFWLSRSKNEFERMFNVLEAFKMLNWIVFVNVAKTHVPRLRLAITGPCMALFIWCIEGWH